LLAEQVTESWTPSSEPEKAAVQQQLEKLLATPLFNSSKRYPSFLKYVVTHSLAGQTDQLKERILGVEIFGRSADYDTNTDPIVRVTAAEIRKRIEQYYQDPKHSQEIRLYLPAGSYAPQYSWPGRPSGLSATATATLIRADDATLILPPDAPSAVSRRAVLTVVKPSVLVPAASAEAVLGTVCEVLGARAVLHRRPEPVFDDSTARRCRPAARNHVKRQHGHNHY
jgi:hypothetical protein